MPKRPLALRRFGFAVAALLAVCVPIQSHAAATASEAEVKAVLFFHLTQFVTWPTSALSSATFDIAILGQDPFGPAIDAVVQGEKVGGKPIRIVRLRRAEEAAGFPLIYVGPRTREPLPRIFSELRQSPTLTVGEAGDFLDEGGMIRFRKGEQNKLRLQIHLTRVRQKGFQISAQLLRVSDVVQEEGR